ncbi:hypothetical protein ACHAQA_008887 [Verticillium albo-atrum]
MLPDKANVLDDGRLDENILAALPDVETVLNVRQHGTSAWAKTYCITALQKAGEEKKYFMKVSVGHHGREALKGEFTSTSTIYSITPSFCPKPIACGTFKGDVDTHFYLCNFYDFTEGLPDPDSFCRQLATLHSKKSTNGKFGFECVTYNGNLPQDNTWFDSWEEFFAHGLRHILALHKERAGPNADLDAVLPPLFETVIPRLLRPLESNGRKVKPSLVHGDLWCGNASIVDEDTEEGIVYDPASFWAHNEYELGNWRPERNKFTQAYFRAYHSHIVKSEPVEDYDDRNALYALRFNLHAATLFPDQDAFVQMAVDEIKRLSARFAGAGEIKCLDERSVGKADLAPHEERVEWAANNASVTL